MPKRIDPETVPKTAGFLRPPPFHRWVGTRRCRAFGAAGKHGIPLLARRDGTPCSQNPRG